MAFLTLFRVATGDNWNGIMKVRIPNLAGLHASQMIITKKNILFICIDIRRAIVYLQYLSIKVGQKSDLQCLFYFIMSVLYICFIFILYLETKKSYVVKVGLLFDVLCYLSGFDTRFTKLQIKYTTCCMSLFLFVYAFLTFIVYVLFLCNEPSSSDFTCIIKMMMTMMIFVTTPRLLHDYL